jgi:hypothetical protein
MISMRVLGCSILLEPPQPRAADGRGAANWFSDFDEYSICRPAVSPRLPDSGIARVAPVVQPARGNLRAEHHEAAIDLPLKSPPPFGRRRRPPKQITVVWPFLSGRARVGAGFCLSDGIGTGWKSARGGFLGVLGGLPRKYYIISSEWRPCWHPLKSAKSAKSANIPPVASLAPFSHLRAAVALGLGATRAIFPGCFPFLSSYQC